MKDSLGAECVCVVGGMLAYALLSHALEISHECQRPPRADTSPPHRGELRVRRGHGEGQTAAAGETTESYVGH